MHLVLPWLRQVRVVGSPCTHLTSKEAIRKVQILNRIDASGAYLTVGEANPPFGFLLSVVRNPCRRFLGVTRGVPAREVADPICQMDRFFFANTDWAMRLGLLQTEPSQLRTCTNSCSSRASRQVFSIARTNRAKHHEYPDNRQNCLRCYSVDNIRGSLCASHFGKPGFHEPLVSGVAWTNAA